MCDKAYTKANFVFRRSRLKHNFVKCMICPMENFQSVCPPIRADLDMIIMSAPGGKAVHPISLKIF